MKPANANSNANKAQKGRIWNNIAINRSKSQDVELPDTAIRKGCGTNQLNQNLPASSAKFLNTWQQSDSPSRLSILFKLGPTGLSQIFSIDMPTALLGEIFEALLGFDPASDVVLVVKLLDALTKIKRFSLVVHFLNAAEKAACKQLILKLLSSLGQREQDLAELGITEWTIQELGKKFLVKVS